MPPKAKQSEEVEEQVANPHLNPALEGKYRTKGTHCRYLLNTSLGDIDLTTLTEEQAEKLASDNIPFFEKIGL